MQEIAFDQDQPFIASSCSEEDLNYILNPKTRTLVCLTFYVLLHNNVLQVKGADSFSIFTKAQRVPAGLRVGLDIFTTDLTTFIHHLEFQAMTFLLNIFS